MGDDKKKVIKKGSKREVNSIYDKDSTQTLYHCVFCTAVNKSKKAMINLLRKDSESLDAENKGTCLMCPHCIYKIFMSHVLNENDVGPNKNQPITIADFFYNLNNDEKVRELVHKIYLKWQNNIENNKTIQITGKPDERESEVEDNYSGDNVLPFKRVPTKRVSSDKDQGNSLEKAKVAPLNAKAIYERLIVNVKGQDLGCRQMATAYSKFRTSVEMGLPKPLTMISGESGSGKTYLVKNLAKAVNAPLVIVNANDLSVEGYVGDSIKSIIKGMAKEQNTQSPRGIVFLDEFDKLLLSDLDLKKDALNSLLNTLQDEFLNSSSDARGKPQEGGTAKINLNKILFILSGSFDRQKHKARRSMSLTVSQQDQAQESLDNPVDENFLINSMRLGREIVGRITTIINLNSLRKEDMLEIVSKENGPLAIYSRHLEGFDCYMNFSKEFMLALIDEAILTNVGSRGLDKIASKYLDKYLFDAEEFRGKTLTINTLTECTVIDTPELETDLKTSFS